MKYEDALAWVKENRASITQAATEGDVHARSIISAHQLLTLAVEPGAIGVFLAAVEGYKNSRPEKQESSSDKCIWKGEANQWGEVWWESCARKDKGFTFEDGGPSENEFRYCPFCGREIHVEGEG